MVEVVNSICRFGTFKSIKGVKRGFVAQLGGAVQIITQRFVMLIEYSVFKYGHLGRYVHFEMLIRLKVEIIIESDRL